jgi:hypothetical protein
MKKLLAAVLLSVSVMLGGCSLLEEANRTLDYANEASNYVNQLTSYGQDIRSLADQAVTDVNALTDLQQKLTALKEEAVQYAQLQAPDYAKDLHAQIVEYNNRLTSEIDAVLAQIEKGVYDNKVLQEAGIIDTLNQLNELLGRVNQLQQS